MASADYFRPEIAAMSGYVPGEQPKLDNLVKLNTNENPYPTSPRVAEVLRDFDWRRLRRYPDPLANDLRDRIAAHFAVKRENVIVGNGSDDLLTMLFRAFTSPELPLAMLDPSYSLYPELAAMQGARVIKLPLQGADFALPENLLELAAPANLLIITRPNAPTGTHFPLASVEKICRNFDGIVAIDEAYADFAPDNCVGLAATLPNVVVLRTFSKSYSLAGLRLGYAIADSGVISGLMKLKDSYNVDALAQAIGAAAFDDQENLRANCQAVISERERVREILLSRGFAVPGSGANFLFASPPDGDAKRRFESLRRQAVIVRYFPGEVTGKYLRITIGTPKENDRLLGALEE